MPKIMKNFVVFLEPPNQNDFDISHKAGRMYMNRFFIDEDAAFELSEVSYFKKQSGLLSSKGKGYWLSERELNIEM